LPDVFGIFMAIFGIGTYVVVSRFGMFYQEKSGNPGIWQPWCW
jgi:hypothetical protein